MGRKIPAKKHRGVKNPLEQQARREKSLKSKINAPPKDPDEQPVPRSLIRLFAFQNKSNTTNKPINKRKQPSNKNNESHSKGRNPVSELERLAGESGRAFSLRINGAVRALHSHSSLSYPSDMEAEDVKGERMAAQRARRRRRRAAAGEGHGMPPPPAPAPPRGGRAPPDLRYERVPFGDVAHAPPALHLKGPAQRPGRRELLLTPLLAGAGVGAGDQAARRDAAVAAYRALNADRRRRPHGPNHHANIPLNKLHT